MVPSLDGLAPFQIGFVVGDLERAARNSTSDRQPAPGGDGSSARKVAGASTKARRPNGRCDYYATADVLGFLVEAVEPPVRMPPTDFTL